MTAHRSAFRFGVNLRAHGDRTTWIAKCRRAERLGFDVIGVPDHLGMPAPFPSMVAAAEATERVLISSFVLNTAFYNPVLLARDIAATDALLGGRLELGLGTGYVKEEFDAAGLPFPGPGARLDHLENCLAALRHHYGAAPLPRIFLGGQRDRMLRIAAREADVVGFTGVTFSRDGTAASLLAPSDMDERVRFVRTESGGRDPELNLLIQRVAVTGDRDAALQSLAPYAPDMPLEQLGESPVFLLGTADEIADRLQEYRERFGIGYVTVMESDMDAFADVIAALGAS